MHGTSVTPSQRRRAPPPIAGQPETVAPRTLVNVRAAIVAMAIGFVLMAVFNSDEMRSTARDLPANALTDRLVVYADRWHALMLALGPAHVRPAVRTAFDDLRAIKW